MKYAADPEVVAATIAQKRVVTLTDEQRAEARALKPAGLRRFADGPPRLIAMTAGGPIYEDCECPSCVAYRKRLVDERGIRTAAPPSIVDRAKAGSDLIDAALAFADRGSDIKGSIDAYTALMAAAAAYKRAMAER